MAILERYKQDNRIGYKDETGTIVINAIYDDGPMCFGVHSGRETPYAIVAKLLSCGIIDENGNEIIPFEYEEIIHLFDNIFAVRRKAEDEQWDFGVIDINGNVLIPFEYKYITNEGRYIKCFRTAVSSRYLISSPQLMDKEGRVFAYDNLQDIEWYNPLGEMIYKGIGKESIQGYLIIQEDTGFGVIDSRGSIIIPTKYKEIHCIREDRFVLRIDIDDCWRFGVMDNKDNIIIPFDYKFISSERDTFYECYRECNCDYTHYSSSKYSDKKEVAWYNEKGELVCTNNSKVISNNYLATQSNDKWGVINQSNKRIVNFLYDDVNCVQDRIVVLKDKCVGILDNDGSIIINPSYSSIECADSNDNSKFDTTDKRSLSYLKPLIRNSRFSEDVIEISNKEDFDFDGFFILTTDKYSELFSVNDGILANSRFEEIHRLTNISFAVRNDDKWGVYRADVSYLIIECNYNRIIFEGGNVVLLQKDGLWGAKTLVLETDPDYKLFYDVEIPTIYKEIEIIDSSELLYGVKRERKNYSGEINEEYTIIDNKGNLFKEMGKFINLDSQCKIFNSNTDRILTSNKDKKWGFISADGYVAIPFQYDEISLREDGFFDVCIDGQYGVIDISGKEVVSIKYSEVIPKEWTNAIVKNAKTHRFGVLAKDGSELVPSIYEYLMVQDGYIFFTHKRRDYGSYTFFCQNEYYAYSDWGVIDFNGKVLINPRYICYKVQDGFLLAGRDGSMIRISDYYEYETDYTGIYDLYSPTGELIFGGFSEFFYNKNNGVYIFFLGGNWSIYSDIDELGYESSGYTYERGNGLWLFLDKNLISIIKDENGNHISFNKGTRISKIEIEFPPEEREHIERARKRINKGTISKIEIEKQEEKNVLKCNLPINIMAKGFRGIDDERIYIGNSNAHFSEYYFAAIDIATGQQTPIYYNLKFVSKNLFFFVDDEKVGLSDYNNVIIPAKFLFVTLPINGYFFAAEVIDKNYARLWLLSLLDESLQEIAIENAEIESLINETIYGRLLIRFENSSHKIEDIIVSKRNLFDEAFVKKVSKNESGNYCSRFEYIYWFSSDYRLEKFEDGYGYNDYRYDQDTDNSWRDAFEDDPEAYWNID